MATTKNSNSQRDMDSSNTGHSSKGNFANMDKKDLKETASKGGRSHGTTSKSHK